MFYLLFTSQLKFSESGVSNGPLLNASILKVWGHMVCPPPPHSLEKTALCCMYNCNVYPADLSNNIARNPRSLPQKLSNITDLASILDPLVPFSPSL